MKEENKYYTPEKFEFCEGLEYEALIPERNCWSIETFYLNKSHLKLIKENQIRVKYLDKDDIESFGFKKIKSSFDYYQTFLREREDHLIHYSSKIEMFKLNGFGRGFLITIKKLTVVYAAGESKKNIEPCIVFNGIIKNKSELKKLLDQLSIIPLNKIL